MPFFTYISGNNFELNRIDRNPKIRTALLCNLPEPKNATAWACLAAVAITSSRIFWFKWINQNEGFSIIIRIDFKISTNPKKGVNRI